MNYVYSPQPQSSFLSAKPCRDLSFSSFLSSNSNFDRSSSLKNNYLSDEALCRNEISIFSAEKYFSGSLEPSPLEKKPLKNDGYLRTTELGEKITEFPELVSCPNTNRPSSVSPANGQGQDNRNNSTAASEASCGRLSGLLSIQTGTLSKSHHTRGKKPVRGSGIWRLGTKCLCIGTKSNESEDHYAGPSKLSSPRNSPLTSTTSQAHTIENKPPKPVTSCGTDTMSTTVTLKTRVISEPDVKFSPYMPERLYRAEMDLWINHGANLSSLGEDSAFNFRDSPVGLRRVSAVLDGVQKEAINGYVTRTVVNYPSHSRRRSLSTETTREYDSESDSSSDLFEIESLTTSNCALYGSRDSFVEEAKGPSGGPNRQREVVIPAVPHSECCAPSEVSVTWSVTTADGFSPARFSQPCHTPSVRKAEPSRTRRSVDLLGCRRDKSVTVALPPMRYAPG